MVRDQPAGDGPRPAQPAALVQERADGPFVPRSVVFTEPLVAQGSMVRHASEEEVHINIEGPHSPLPPLPHPSALVVQPPWPRANPPGRCGRRLRGRAARRCRGRRAAATATKVMNRELVSLPL